MAPGLCRLVLLAIMRGICYGLCLSPVALFGTLGAESVGELGQLAHFIVEGALTVGLANGIATLLVLSNEPRNKTAINSVFVGEYGCFTPLMTCFGFLLAVILAKPSGVMPQWSRWTLQFMVWGWSGFYVLCLLRWLVNPAWRRRKPLASVFIFMSAPVVCPLLGYCVGTAVTLLPGASGWSLALPYGIILGVAAGIVLCAFASAFGVKGGDVAKGSDERATKPV